MRKTKPWLLAIAMLCCSLTASAHDFEVDGIYYNITSEEDLTVEVTFQGFYYYYYSEYRGDVIIPSSVTYSGKTYQVTSIGQDAFCICSSLTSIEIPSSVTSIGDYAFYNCSSLTSIEIPNSVTNIGRYAFNITPWYDSQPDGVMYINNVLLLLSAKHRHPHPNSL